MEDLYEMKPEYDEFQEGFTIDSDSKAEWAIRKIAEDEAEADRVISVAKEKLKFYQGCIEETQKKCENKTMLLRSLLRSYMGRVKAKETKTQLSYALPSGKLKVTKAHPDFAVDDEKLLAFLKENAPDMVKVTEKPAWGEYKKGITLMESDGKMVAVDGFTGIQIDGVEVIEKEEKFSIDFAKEDK